MAFFRDGTNYFGGTHYVGAVGSTNRNIPQQQVQETARAAENTVSRLNTEQFVTDVGKGIGVIPNAIVSTSKDLVGNILSSPIVIVGGILAAVFLLRR